MIWQEVIISQEENTQSRENTTENVKGAEHQSNKMRFIAMLTM